MYTSIKFYVLEIHFDAYSLCAPVVERRTGKKKKNSKARQGKARQGKARQGKASMPAQYAGQGRAGQGRAGQGSCCGACIACFMSQETQHHLSDSIYPWHRTAQ